MRWVLGRRVRGAAIMGLVALAIVFADSSAGRGPVGWACLSDTQLAGIAPLPRTRAIGVVEAMECVLVASYLAWAGTSPVRLFSALAALALASVGAVSGALAGATAAHPIYRESFGTQLLRVSVLANASAYACAALGGLVSWRLGRRYLPTALLLAASGVGVLALPLASSDPRRWVLVVGESTSLRASLAELAHVAAWLVCLYLGAAASGDRALGWLLGPARARVRRQESLVAHYHRWVGGGWVKARHPAWERMLVGSGLSVRYEDRRYHGVPTLRAARWRTSVVERWGFAARVAWRATLALALCALASWCLFGAA